MFLDEYYLNLTNLEKDILNKIYEDMPKYIDVNIQDCAQLLFTTSATITKLTRKIGFESYKSFQKHLKEEYELRRANSKKFGEHIQELVEMFETLKTNTKEMREDQFGQIADSIINASKVVTVGFGNSLLAANDLHQSLSRMGFNTYCTNDIFGNLTLFENIDKNSLIIFYSHSFKSRTIFRAYKLINSLGLKSILISSNCNVPEEFGFINQIVYKSNSKLESSLFSKISQFNINSILKNQIKLKIKKTIKDKPSALI